MKFAARAVVLLAMLPLLVAVLESLRAPRDSGYAWWWGTPRGWVLLGQTLSFAAVAAIVAMIAAWPVATCAARMPRQAAVFMLAVACLPLVLPSSLLGTAWIMAMGHDGWLTRVLQATVGHWPWTIYHWPVAACAVGLRYVGLAALVLVPESRRQARSAAADRLLRISFARRLIHLQLRPALKPAAGAALLTALLAANDHILPGMFLISTYGVQVIIEHQALLNPTGAAALSTPMLMIAALLAILVTVGQQHASSDSSQAPRATVRPGRLSCTFAICVLMLAIGVPLLALMVRAGTWAAIAQAWAASAEERRRTIHLAAIGGAMCALAGMAPAACWVRGGQRRAVSAAPLLAVIVLAPASLLALGIIALFERPPLRSWRDSDLPLIAAYICRYTPIAVLILIAAWSHVPAAAMGAARVHGVTLAPRIAKLGLPLYGPAAVAAAGICALFIATELELSLMLTPPGITTLGVRLYSMIHTAPDAVVSAAAIGLTAAITISIGAAMVLWAWWTRGRRCPT